MPIPDGWHPGQARAGAPRQDQTSPFGPRCTSSNPKAVGLASAARPESDQAAARRLSIIGIWNPSPPLTVSPGCYTRQLQAGRRSVLAIPPIGELRGWAEVQGPRDLSHWTLPRFMLCVYLVLIGLCDVPGGETGMVGDDDVTAEHAFLGQVRKLAAEHRGQTDVSRGHQTDLRWT